MKHLETSLLREEERNWNAINIGYFKKDAYISEVRVRVLGLQMHF